MWIIPTMPQTPARPRWPWWMACRSSTRFPSAVGTVVISCRPPAWRALIRVAVRRAIRWSDNGRNDVCRCCQKMIKRVRRSRRRNGNARRRSWSGDWAEICCVWMALVRYGDIPLSVELTWNVWLMSVENSVLKVFSYSWVWSAIIPVHTGAKKFSLNPFISIWKIISEFSWHLSNPNCVLESSLSCPLFFRCAINLRDKSTIYACDFCFRIMLLIFFFLSLAHLSVVMHKVILESEVSNDRSLTNTENSKMISTEHCKCVVG